MQFVRGGPDIPARLLQAHEDGEVVFFCGAGISRPAGLPTFSGLVKQLYDAMRIEPDPVEAAAIKAGQYDTAVGLLETKVMGGRQAVRTKLAEILTPNLDARNTPATHEALLTLGKDRKDRTRLITTNFDRLFEAVLAGTGRQVERFRAPRLPVPKGRWDGLVYLHGLLTENPSENDLERLVVSSGDFGRAYLTEHWAARFVTELLRNFVVCFVGYSIDDPVMRYMVDAIAAEKESPLEMFAFGSFFKGKEEDAKRKWRAKNVTPILYREYRRHAYLHRTLRAWSETYRDGVRGKERIVVEGLRARPLAGTKQDNFVVGRMIWALSDSSGLPARRFAEFDPAPSLEWLKPLSEAFVDSGARPTRWDKVMAQIGRWLIRHLDDRAALLWLVERGDVLHKNMAWGIEQKLKEFHRLEEDNDQAKLNEIRANAPNAIPRPGMRTLWQLLLKGRVRARVDETDFDPWCDQFRRNGLTVILRLDLREKLTPRVELKEPFVWPTEEEDEEADGPAHMSRLVDAEVVLSTPDVRSQLRGLAGDERWDEALPELLDEFTGLLRDALNLMRELGQADERSDPSHYSQPSISEHSQNSDFRDWTVLIELVRDAWLATCARSTEKARAAAEGWWEIPYPVFRRLAFFAAAQNGIIPQQRALDWLLSDSRWWLWTPETLREAMRLLVALAPRLTEAELERVEKAILAGPPRAMYRDDIDEAFWGRIQDQDIWLRLAKLAENGTNLSAAGAERLDEISARYKGWQLSENERDEFSTWMREGNEGREFVATPRGQKALIEWLKANAENDPQQGDDWPARCREEFDTACSALSALAAQEIWPRRRWREALQVWTGEEEELLKCSWDKMASIVARLPDEDLYALSGDVGHWLRMLATRFEGEDTTFLGLCDRIFELEYEEEVDDPVGRALNHPVGHATDALLQWRLRSPIEDGQGLDGELRSRFSRICDSSIGKFRHGRLMLAADAIRLFRVDRKWTTRYVLPLFEWECSEAEARAAWQGFLGGPRLYHPLMEAFKPAFLDTVKHYEKLGRYGVQYSSLLTLAAMNPADVFKRPELATATKALPQEGLDNAAEMLARTLEGAGGRRAEYWKNRVKPYLKHVWPQTRDVASESIAKRFARMCVEAGGEFPAALREVRHWLQAMDYPEPVVRRLHKAKLHERFPAETLDFLDVIIAEDGYLLPKDLKECLQAICAAMPELRADHRFRRLVEYLLVHGQTLD